MRYRLRTLLIFSAIGPPALAVLWFYGPYVLVVIWAAIGICLFSLALGYAMAVVASAVMRLALWFSQRS